MRVDTRRGARAWAAATEAEKQAICRYCGAPIEWVRDDKTGRRIAVRADLHQEHVCRPRRRRRGDEEARK